MIYFLFSFICNLWINYFLHLEVRFSPLQPNVLMTSHAWAGEVEESSSEDFMVKKFIQFYSYSDVKHDLFFFVSFLFSSLIIFLVHDFLQHFYLRLIYFFVILIVFCTRYFVLRKQRIIFNSFSYLTIEYSFYFISNICT